MGVRHLIVALLSATTLAAAPAQDAPAEVTFNISVRGQRLGQEIVTLTRTADGWRISSTGRQAGPAEFTIDKFEAAYGPDWEPRSLELEATRLGQVTGLSTTFGPAGAVNIVSTGPDRRTTTVPVSPRTVMLPNDFFGAYEAMAARLAGAAVGTVIPMYVAPTAEVQGTVTAVTPQRLQTPDALVLLKHYSLTVRNPAGNVIVDVGVDAAGRLARVAVPAAGILVLRSDLSNVMTRDVTFTNATDQSVFIPALGFTIAGTTTTPEQPTGPLPAVVFVGGVNASDRDETIAGVTIWGQLAGALAKAGFLVVRYDKRGIGQSGGRTESVTLQDYADDAVNVVKWVRKQKSVDPRRVALIGRAEGAAAALLAAARAGSDVAAVGLLAGPGMSGREFVLAQQAQALARSADTPEVKAIKVQLQTRILEAVKTGKGWDTVPPAMRQQAETLWFKSWVEFDPATVMKKVDQPLLVAQGTRDTEYPPQNAERLELLAQARTSKSASVRKVLFPGLNHLLVPAATGDVSEYATLASRTIPADVPQAIAEWLRVVMPAGR